MRFSNRKLVNNSSARRYALLGFGVCLILLQSLSKTNESIHTITRSLQIIEKDGSNNLQEDTNNTHQIQQWRTKYQNLCNDDQSTKEDLIGMLKTFLQPQAPTNFMEDSNEPCQNVFLDFGANIGDSLGKFIDSAVDSCPAKDIQKNPRLDLDAMTYGDIFHGKENRLVRSTRTILQQLNLHPEDYCYFGIEGNPRFTTRLKSIEQRILHQIHPRPVRKAHFFTETVGAEKDGPTTLYLDTVNKDQNFWGSSTLANHRDVQLSAAKGLQQAPVQGITLSTLLQQTAQKTNGGHVLIKMDIEGGEYGVLEEAYQSGVLCQYDQAGVKIHLILETHRPDVIGMKNFDLQHWRLVQRAFKECGVIIQKGREVDT